MKKVSDKQAKRLREYAKVRKKYMSEHDICEVKECNRTATDIHHRKGRIGSLLTDTVYFMAVCRQCHRIIEDSPHYAKENGYSLNRLT